MKRKYLFIALGLLTLGLLSILLEFELHDKGKMKYNYNILNEKNDDTKAVGIKRQQKKKPKNQIDQRRQRKQQKDRSLASNDDEMKGEQIWENPKEKKTEELNKELEKYKHYIKNNRIIRRLNNEEISQEERLAMGVIFERMTALRAEIFKRELDKINDEIREHLVKIGKAEEIKTNKAKSNVQSIN